MSKLSLLILALSAAACSNSGATNNSVPPPTGAPRQAKGTLPMTMPAKTVTAVKEMGGKPVVAARAPVTTTGAFNFSIEVGVRYTFIITLVDGSEIQLFATDASSAYWPWLPIGNSLDGSAGLDFGTLSITNGYFISTTVLHYVDWDGDGIADFTDDDDDNDGIPDEDDYDIDGDGDEDNYLDTDGDGQCDLADDDDDNDGIADVDDDDDDGDGINDADEPDVQVDIDGDGVNDGGDDGDGCDVDCDPGDAAV